MIMDLLGIADSEVAHVVFATLLADLEIRVSMNLSDLRLGNAGLAMKAVNVLRDDVL